MNNSKSFTNLAKFVLVALLCAMASPTVGAELPNIILPIMAGMKPATTDTRILRRLCWMRWRQWGCDWIGSIRLILRVRRLVAVS
jgi:hypothetical protein